MSVWMRALFAGFPAFLKPVTPVFPSPVRTV